MFETLKGKLQTVFDGLAKRGALSEADVDAALREVRLALLDADVALPVVKSFIEKLRNEAVGVASLRAVRPDQQVIKIVHEALIEMLGGDAAPLNIATNPPSVVPRDCTINDPTPGNGGLPGHDYQVYTGYSCYLQSLSYLDSQSSGYQASNTA